MSKLLRAMAPVTANEALGERFIRLTIAFPALAAAAQPGQFLSLVAAPGGLPLLRRPFSIHRVDADGNVQLLIKIVGQGTRALAEIRPGDQLDTLGPLGDGVFSLDPARPRVIMVAGGIGVAPFLFLADRLGPRADPPPSLVFGGRDRADLVGLESFGALGVDVRPTTEDGSLGRRGLVTDELAALLDAGDPRRTLALACGPTPMLRAVARLCRERGAACQVSFENLMACGVGACRGCVVPVREDPTGHGIPFARVCHEGPVFPADQLDWERVT